MLRPGIVWFGEPLPLIVWNEAESAVLTSDTFLTVGTSAVVYPAAGLISLAKSAGARVIEVNLEETAFSSQADFSLRGKAGEILPELIQ